ncbi:MAG: hypothetical protein ACD_59C00053G0008 [uncultured bacterium]|nr:MAG: hypothetical protein ACD_59C00053G0008 [uncultured bacterium]
MKKYVVTKIENRNRYVLNTLMSGERKFYPWWTWQDEYNKATAEKLAKEVGGTIIKVEEILGHKTNK